MVGKDSNTGAEKAVAEYSFTEKRHALRRHEMSNKGITNRERGRDCPASVGQAEGASASRGACSRRWGRYITCNADDAEVV